MPSTWITKLSQLLMYPSSLSREFPHFHNLTSVGYSQILFCGPTDSFYQQTFRRQPFSIAVCWTILAPIAFLKTLFIEARVLFRLLVVCTRNLIKALLLYKWLQALLMGGEKQALFSYRVRLLVNFVKLEQQFCGFDGLTSNNIQARARIDVAMFFY